MDDLDQQRLLQDLLPSPPAQIRPYLAPSAFWGRQVTVGDLRNRVCWICQDGDDEQSEEATEKESEQTRTGSSISASQPPSSPSSAQAERRKRAQRRFVHPCKCTLVAHETCLLRWIHRKSTAANPVVSCPQCAHPFSLYSPRPLSLRFFEYLDKRITSAMPVAGGGLIVGGVATCCMAYGYLLSKAWLGNAVARRIFAGGLPWDRAPEMIFLPAGLMVLASPLTDDFWSVLPLAFFVPIFRAQVAFLDSIVPRLDSFQSRQWSVGYPPGPGVSVLFLPWAKAAWRNVYWHLTRFVLRPFIKPKGTQGGGARSSNLTFRPTLVLRNRRARIVFDIDDSPEEEDVPQLDDDGDESEEGQAQVIREEALEAEFRRRPEGEWTIRITGLAVCKYVVHTLALPFVACAVGEVLQSLAFYFMARGNWLERLLALQSVRSYKAGLYGRGRTSVDVSSPLPRLGSSQNSSASFSGLQHEHRSASGQKPHVGPGAWYLGQPSLHWRNTIAACLCVVARDSASLAYRYLRVRQRTRTRVVDRPFEDSLIESLDLRRRR